MTEHWHASDELLQRFVVDPAALDGAAAASLEAHLIACDRCRSSLNDDIGADQVATSWSSIAQRIDAAEALAAGTGARPTRCVRGDRSPDRRDTCAAGGSARGGRRRRSRGGRRAAEQPAASGGFLVIAPLLPLAVVAAAFAPTSDPAGEAGIATPLHGIGLVLRRSSVVLAAVFIVLGIAALAIGDLQAPVIGWLLPSWALAVAALALGTWLRAEVAAGALAFGWVVVVSLSRWMEGRTSGYADSPGVRHCRTASAALMVLVVALGVVHVRRDRFQTMEVQR